MLEQYRASVLVVLNRKPHVNEPTVDGLFNGAAEVYVGHVGLKY